MRKRDVLIGISLANVCFLRAWGELLVLDNPANSYLVKVSSADFLGLALNVVGLGLLLAWAMAWVRRTRGHGWRVVAEWALLCAVLLPINALRTTQARLTVAQLSPWLAHPVGHITTVAVALAGAVCVWWWRSRLARAAAWVLLVLSPFVLITFGRSAWQVVRYDPDRTHADGPLAPMLAGAPGRQHAVFLLFDELDYRLAFEDRHPTVHLPELDRLRDEAVFTTHAHPPGVNTYTSIPALFTGEPVHRVRAVGARDALIEFTSGEQEIWGSRRSWFSEARDLGVNGAVAGCCLPYCRELSGQLSACSWYPFWPVAQGRRSLPAAMADQLVSLSPWHLRYPLLQLYRATLRDAVRMSTDPAYGFVYVHWVLPHGPWMYDREHDRITIANRKGGEGYFDNLEFTDRTLGAVRAAMERTGLWGQSVVIVTSDHGLLEPDPATTGRKDDRVPLLIKPAGRHPSVVYDRPFNTLLLHRLVLALLAGEVREPAQITGWIDAHVSEVPVMSQATNTW